MAGVKGLGVGGKGVQEGLREAGRRGKEGKRSVRGMGWRE